MPILAELFAAYPSASLAPETAKARVSAYLGALADRPAWAVRAAAMRWIRGDVDASEKALDFPPSAARLHDLATKEMSGLYEEIAKLKTLRTARVTPKIDPATAAMRRAQVEAVRPALKSF